jgi:hypothetical protein
MKNPLLAVAALLVVSGIVSVNLWRDLRSERLANTNLKTELAKVRVTPSSQAASALPAAAPSVAALVPAAPAATTVTAPLPIDNEMATKALAAAISAGAVAAAKGSGEVELMKDPEYRKAQLTMNRLRIAQSNPGLVETLGLSRKEADHLFEAMADRQMNLSAELTEAMARAGGAASAVTELLRTTAGREDPARAVLGEAKFAQYQEYQRNVRPALTQVASIGSSLSAAGQPLNESQNRALTAAMMIEQQRQRQEAAMPRPNPTPGVPRGVADSLEETANRQQQSNRRILEASAATLNAAQLEVLKQQFEQQDAVRRRSIETAKDLDARRLTLPQPEAPPARVP